MGLRELAAAWVRANCPNPAVHKDFLHHLDRAFARGVGCTFLVGGELTKRAKPMLVACHCGELFAFDLTPQQAKRLKAGGQMLVCSQGLVKQDHGPKPEPVVSIEYVSVENAAAINRELPVTGMLHYRTSHLFFEPVAIQVACEPSGRSNKLLYHPQRDLRPPEGTIRFVLGALGDLLSASGDPFVGPLPLFFRFVATGSTPAELSSPTPGNAGVSFLPTPGSPFLKMGKPPLPPRKPTIPLAMPANTSFPPPFDPGQPVVSIPIEARAISDVRAVLVDVVR